AGILTEHHGGRFPVWLAPVQAAILPVADRHGELAAALAVRLGERGIRCRVDERSESVGKKIHDAEVGKYPYMLVIGDREQERDEVSVRSHTEGDLGAVSVDEFIARVEGEASDS